MRKSFKATKGSVVVRLRTTADTSDLSEEKASQVQQDIQRKLNVLANEVEALVVPRQSFKATKGSVVVRLRATADTSDLSEEKASEVQQDIQRKLNVLANEVEALVVPRDFYSPNNYRW